MTDQPNDAQSATPTPEVLAEIDRLHAAATRDTSDIPAQIALWTAVAKLGSWVLINRGTQSEPRPYMLAAQPGHMMAIYSSAETARECARANGLVTDDEPVSLFAVPLPQALDWAMSFGQYGVAGVTLDYPSKGAWCPLPNLARLRPSDHD